MDIKPPQANRIVDSRYKEKKSSKDKKHSREQRQQQRQQQQQHRLTGGGGGSDRGDDRRHRHRNDNVPRHHSFGGSGGRTSSGSGGYETSHQQIRGGGGGGIRGERDPYRKERERDKQRSDRSKDRRRESSGDKTEADRMLEDLRSRLLSKRSKIESEKRHDDRIPTGIEYDSSHRNRYEYESRRMEKESRNDYYQQQHHHNQRGDTREYHQQRDRKQMIEVIDSPENYDDNHHRSSSQQHHHKESSRHSRPLEDKEQAARRAKLLEADREMARRKELAREELEARRELRRERDGTEIGSDRSESEEDEGEIKNKKKKRRSSTDREGAKRLRGNGGEVVMVSDNTDDDTADTESEYGSSSHSEEGEEEEEEEEEARDNRRQNVESKDEVSDGELPGSPLSVGELTKSDLRRSQSRSQSRSISPLSKSRSLSKSPSRSPSISPRRGRGRSKSKTPTELGDDDDQKDIDGDTDDDVEEDEAPPKIEEPIPVEVKDELPPYFPAIQGCRSVEEFQCLNRIEEGTYGVVYRAKDKRTNEIVALKRLKMEREKEGFPITSLREINTLLKGQHPNIVTVREIVVGSNMDKIFIVMDYVEHDLKSLMETMKYKKQVFLPGEVKCLTHQLLRAVAHLHDNWILHRDLKTSNLLLSHKGILKVGDFGLAREYGSPLKAYTSIVVTLWYRAPELLLCCKEYSIPIDMWSVGCIFAEFLAMSALFPGKSEVDQLNRIFKDLGTPNERIWNGYNDLPAVQKMTFTEYPVSQLRKKFSHLTSELGISLLQGLLTYDPKQRLTADQALKSSYFKVGLSHKCLFYINSLLNLNFLSFYRNFHSLSIRQCSQHGQPKVN